MATGKIVKHGLGALSTVTFPFTAQSDGFLIMQINPSSSGGAYGVVVVDNDSNQRLQLSTVSGTGLGGTLPIRKGQTATGTLSNCTWATKSFIQLL